MKNIIKFVFWDFGDTLVSLKNDVLYKFIDIIFQRCGQRVGVTNLIAAMRDEWMRRGQQDEWDKIKRVITPEMELQYYADFFGGTLARLGFDDSIPPELTTELATLKVTPSSYHDFLDALEAVNIINKLGIKQAIISNGFHTAPEILKQSKLQDKFEFEIWSYNHGTIKPEQKIYEIALEEASCLTEEAIFIDDRRAFVEAAHKLGMLAIQIDRSQPRNIELVDHSILVINNLSEIEKCLPSQNWLGDLNNIKQNTTKRNNWRIAVS